jgi:hypothetical protein
MVTDDASLVRLDIAQRLWGWGNLSPLDDVFGSMTIVRLALTRNSKFGLIACRLGGRLQRYSKEAGLWIDAFESEQRHPGLHKEKDTKCTLRSWAEDEAMLGDGKYTDVAVFEPAGVSSLPLIYSQCAKGLKDGGKLFVADLMAQDTISEQSSPVPLGRVFHSVSEHERALAASGLALQTQVDLSRDVLIKVRQGLIALADLLVEARKLDNPKKKLTRAALGSQVETWARIGARLDTGAMTATGLLALKR